MKFTGEIGTKILKRALIVAGTVAGISLVATLAKDEPETEEAETDVLEEGTEEESEENESEEG